MVGGPGMSRLYGWMLLLASGVLLVDQVTKFWAVSALSDGRQISVIPGFLSFRLLYNAGAAFSTGTSITWVFAITAACAIVKDSIAPNA